MAMFWLKLFARRSEVGARRSEVGARGSEVSARSFEVDAKPFEVGAKHSEVAQGSEVGTRKTYKKNLPLAGFVILYMCLIIK